MPSRPSSFGWMRESTGSVLALDQRSGMGPIHEGFVQLYRGKLFSKWKRCMGAVFEANCTGLARLELYASDKQLSAVNPARTVLLSECVAIRMVELGKNDRAIQIQQRSAPVLLLHAQDMAAWHTVLCRVAFPNQFVSIPPSPCAVSPCKSGDYAVPADAYSEHGSVSRVPVLLQRVSGTAKPPLAQGNYDMLLNRSLVLSDGTHSLECLYLSITWFATGCNCFAFEVSHEVRYEFACSQPLAALHALRCHTALSNVDTPPKFATSNTYLYFYIPSSLKWPCAAKSIESSNQDVSRAQAAHSRSPFVHRRVHERADFEVNADDEWVFRDGAPLER